MTKFFQVCVLNLLCIQINLQITITNFLLTKKNKTAKLKKKTFKDLIKKPQKTPSCKWRQNVDFKPFKH